MLSGEGASVLVTGGCGGLGGVLSLHLAKKGWTVFPTSRDGASAEAFREQAGVLPLHPVVWRWEREEDVRDGFGELERAMGAVGAPPLGALVHTVASRKPQVDWRSLCSADWEEEYLLSSVRFFEVARRCALYWRDRALPGAVVAVSSIYGHHAVDPGIYDDFMMENGLFAGLPYAAAKAALEHLVRCLARLWGPWNIRVNAVAPGGVRNPERQSVAFVEAYGARTPLGRLGNLEEMGGAVAFLLSSEASYVTGTVLPVDGGWDTR
ncbi:MAG TPA: SDR family oxidoreductase [Synergistaceae bacterium]|mgnify:CR=1 FL=1|nr:SDR family oxidoreductase [Synergistaceae bacterium]